MSQVQRQTGDTRERILDVASELFAEMGYRATTVAMICRQAAANIAAVNYHFGSKERLYQEAWRHAHDQLRSKIPPDGGVSDDKPAEERLRGRILGGFQRAMFGDAVEMGIMRNEMASPTGLLRQVIDDTIRPLREDMKKIIGELLGPTATENDIEICEVCVVSPWMHVTHRRQAERHEGLAPVFHEDMLDELVEQFTAFALAGIREMRRRIEAGGSRPQK